MPIAPWLMQFAMQHNIADTLATTCSISGLDATNFKCEQYFARQIMAGGEDVDDDCPPRVRERTANTVCKLMN